MSSRLFPWIFILVAPALTLAGCDTDPAGPGAGPPGESRTVELDFSGDPQGWEPGFAHFPVGGEEKMELDAGHAPLPEGLDREGGGLFIGATNRSDDVFMFWKGRVPDLVPEARYRVAFEVEFATDSPAGCVGIGGPPGESVWVKAGATPFEPEAVVDASGPREYWLMNLDKGNQSVGGEDALLLGDVGTEAGDCHDWKWAVKTVESEEELEVRADEDGGVWLLVGTDSGFEGRTELYYTRVRAVFEPM